MGSSLHNHEQAAQPSLGEPSLLDWYSLSPGPEIRVPIGNNAASALGILAMMENLQEGYDIEFVGTGVKIPAQTISGIHRRDVQAFRESETYPYTEGF